MRMPPKSSARLLCCLAIIVITFTLVASLPAGAAPLPGAIFTTDTGCGGVDLNIYSDKAAVFLDGGPAHPGAASLPDGAYYVQVTDPSGAVLLGSSVTLPVGSGVGFDKPFVVSNNGTTISCFGLSTGVGHSGVADGFIDTPNAGGEYKVWVSDESTFTNNSTKTDNFKVNPSGGGTPPPPGSIAGVKFYDFNLNGVQDTGEAGINAWEVWLYTFQPTTLYSTEVTHTVPPTTGTVGVYSFDGLDPSTVYGVCEVLPSASPVWIPTTLDSANVLPGTTVNFGNVCLGAGSGLTLGFWSNKNGQALITAGQLCLLDSLNLVNGAGAPFDPVAGCSSPSSAQISTGKTNLKNWLLSAKATNMAYMLSAQLATMELNTTNTTQGTPIQDPSANVYLGASTASDCADAGVTVTLANSNGFASITNLMAAGNTALGVSGGNNTTKTSLLRTCQEDLKTALDNANNNQTFVQSSACEVNYSVGDACTP
jgi:hypothetical protein